MASAMGDPGAPRCTPRCSRSAPAMAGGQRRAVRAPRPASPRTMGFDFTLRAFIVVVVGGMGNLGGSILAAIFISLLEAYASLVVSARPRRSSSPSWC